MHDASFLRLRGWRKSPKGWTHVNLRFPWPVADALDLERDRDRGEKAAVGLLGPMVWLPDKMPAEDLR